MQPVYKDIDQLVANIPGQGRSASERLFSLRYLGLAWNVDLATISSEKDDLSPKGEKLNRIVIKMSGMDATLYSCVSKRTPYDL